MRRLVSGSIAVVDARRKASLEYGTWIHIHSIGTDPKRGGGGGESRVKRIDSEKTPSLAAREARVALAEIRRFSSRNETEPGEIHESS